MDTVDQAVEKLRRLDQEVTDRMKGAKRSLESCMVETQALGSNANLADAATSPP